MKPKPFYKSQTIQFSAAVTLGGVLLILELLIGAFDVTQLPPEIAVWAGPSFLLLGLLFGALRVKTAVPLRGTAAGKLAEEANQPAEPEERKAWKDPGKDAK